MSRTVAVVRRARAPRGGARHPVWAALRALGFDAQLVDDGSPHLAEADIAWFGGSVNWFPRSWPSLESLPRERRPIVVLWHIEPLPLPAAAGLRLERRHLRELAKLVLRDPRRSDPKSNFGALRRLIARGLPDVLAVSASERKLFLAEQGIPSDFVPLGYDTDAHGRDLALERDIDVLFLGALDVPRRRRILRRLRRAGVDVRIAGDWNDPAFWDDERMQLLNRSKILLNVPRHPGMLSGQRMLLGMANKALVVAEPIYRPEPYRPGVHYVSAELASMHVAIARFLEDADARLRITDEAYALVRGSLTMTSSVRRILELTGPAFRPVSAGASR